MEIRSESLPPAERKEEKRIFTVFEIGVVFAIAIRWVCGSGGPSGYGRSCGSGGPDKSA